MIREERKGREKIKNKIIYCLLSSRPLRSSRTKAFTLLQAFNKKPHKKNLLSAGDF